MRGPSAAVVGCGVIGLTTGLRAQADGYAVTIYADRPPTDTTSTKAAASFKPVEVAYTDATHRLVQPSWDEYMRILGEHGAACGVRRHLHWDAGSVPLDPPPYLEVMDQVEACERPHVPGGYAFGWRYVTFFIDTPIFLPWLVNRFEGNGGRLVILERSFASLDEVAALPYDVVFNCTGLGSRALCGDENLVPVKGQIAIVDRQPDMDWSIKADGFYVYPRANDTVLGGTAEWNTADETVERGAVDAIMRANRRILPHLQTTQVRRAYAGLRPYRTGGVRVELDASRGRPIVHNYGHGGAGFTLCWGSARMALDLVR